MGTNSLKTKITGISKFAFYYFILPALIIMVIGFVVAKFFNYSYDYYFYACPEYRDNSKCYKVKAELANNSYNENAPYTVKIITFDNGNKLAYEYCDYDKNKDKLICYEEGDKGKYWELKLDEKIRVNK